MKSFHGRAALEKSEAETRTGGLRRTTARDPRGESGKRAEKGSNPPCGHSAGGRSHNEKVVGPEGGDRIPERIREGDACNGGGTR